MLIILILLYIQTNFCYNVTINSSNIPKECLLNYKNTNFVSKSEILSNDEYKARQYYCNKDSDICVYTGKEDIASYIKFKDKNGNLKNYIAATCPYTYNITRCYGDEYKLINSDDYVYCSYKCTKDSDCLYNKCINNVCVYNEKSSIIHCEEIYTRVYKYFDHTYVHCGKPNHEFCSSNEECSSEKCKPRYTICATEQCSSEKYNSYCALNYFDPYGYKGNTFAKFIAKCFIFAPILIFILICVYCCCSIRHNKKH
ncbi:hypothetical protein BCR32DRAFT_292309 [Anaeromyces robustus]|uniref:Uncharacterized protein n=1 Tax=Anaeromyces robustus TaxID=1754192 RepID=A0A1Y1XB06_9FUNG|nr:hypothetical protein BCR32DRAFT_292309 [Anaeromyces robustus]|eukprot:ORX82918.1 hypothetical protein BCR32DRAFT_292309 [Anaeromyces robustus]